MWIIIVIVVIIIVLLANSQSSNKRTDSETERQNSVRFVIKTDSIKFILVDFTSESVIFNGTAIGSYSVNAEGYTVVKTQSGIVIKYKLDEFCSFINETKNKRLTSYRYSIKGGELISPECLQVSDRYLSTQDDELLASFLGDRNGAVATFVCAYTELINQNQGGFHAYFTS